MAPITLSRDEFLKRNPGGKYKNYIQYVTSQRAARAAARTNPISLDALKQRIYASIPTLKQQREQAQWLVNEGYGAQARALRQASLEEQQAAERQARAAEGFALAFQPMQASFDQSIRNAYAQGAGGINADVSSLAAANTAAQQNALAQANADVARIAPVEGGVPAPAPGAGAAQLTANGALAASVPGAMASGYFSGASPLSPMAPRGPYVTPQSARLADIGSEYRYKAIGAAKDLNKALAELYAKRPDDMRKAMTSSDDQRLQTLAALTNVLTLQNTMRETTSDIASTQADIAAQNAATKLNKRKQFVAEMAAQGLTPEGKPLPNYYIAGDGSVQKVPQQYTIGKDGKLKPVPYPSTIGGGKNGKKAKVATAGDIKTMQTSMLDAARERLNITTGALIRGAKPVNMTKLQIANYLMATLGNAYVETYQNPKQVQQWVATVSERVYAELQDRLKKTGAGKGKGKDKDKG